MLDGEAEATASDQRMRLAAGGIALVPATVPHGLPNVGQGTLRIVGFFSSAAVISHFAHTLAPFGRPGIAGREGATGTTSTFGPPRERGGPDG
jgi:oxalate decarboxylase/phosphoglucose isomerase-like protein (cupin superfamily)